MSKIAIFPGSFDPFTVGHESVVNRSVDMFDKVIIAIGNNSEKKGLLSIENRIKLIKDVFVGNPKVEVELYQGLTVNFCKEKQANYILRGLRTAADFEYERAIAQINKNMHHDIETVFLLTMPEHTPISSTIVKDVLLNNGDVSNFIPENVEIKDYI